MQLYLQINLCSCGWINQHRVRKDWQLQAWLRSEERREVIVHLKTMMLVRRRLADVRVRVWYIWSRYIYIYGVHLRSSINLLCQAFISSNCIFRQIAKHKQIRVFSFIFPIIQINCPRIPCEWLLLWSKVSPGRTRAEAHGTVVWVSVPFARLGPHLQNRCVGNVCVYISVLCLSNQKCICAVHMCVHACRACVSTRVIGGGADVGTDCRESPTTCSVSGFLLSGRAATHLHPGLARGAASTAHEVASYLEKPPRCLLHKAAICISRMTFKFTK